MLDTGHPDVVPTKVGNHFKDWFPVSTGNPGFRLEFIPMKIGAGMTILIMGVIYKQTLISSSPIEAFLINETNIAPGLPCLADRSSQPDEVEVE